MPTTQLKNIVYQTLLPFCPSPRGHMEAVYLEHPLVCADRYLRVLTKHHVLGASLLLRDADGAEAKVHVSVGGRIGHRADESTLYRVASITKTATALTILRLTERGLVSPEAEACELLPELKEEKALRGITCGMLLSHTSGLCDTPSYPAALAHGGSVREVLQDSGVRTAAPGTRFQYSNFGYGLLGCIIEQTTGRPVSEVMAAEVFRPLGMEATLDASALDVNRIMPIRRVIDPRSTDVRVTELGKIPLTEVDPMRHFGHTAGAMYTNAPSLDRMLAAVAGRGLLPDGTRWLAEKTVDSMTTAHAAYGPQAPGMRYGYGLFLADEPDVSPSRIIGHQGFAYGCVDGAFIESGTGRRVIFLNGGASELRRGRMGRVNLDVLRWALREEMPAWR